MRRIFFSPVIVLLVPLFAAAAERKADPLWVVVNAPDRTDEDKKDDAVRKPLEVLRFSGVKPGMKVADLGAGGGYMTELLQRSVGEKGTVYAQNPKMFIEKFLQKVWPERLARPVNKSVVRVDREFDDPLPPEAKNLDMVVNAFTYHDTVWMGADRDKMNKAVFAALKPGGVYFILDHAGRDGTGTTETQKLHRIEEKALVEEVQKAGFKLESSADFLRNKADSRETNVFDKEIRGKTDRFVLKFVKP
jgi:predicted methyltransferase